MAISSKILEYLFCTIPWLTVAVIAFSYLHSQIISGYSVCQLNQVLQFSKISGFYESIIWTLIMIWLLSIPPGILLLFYLSVERKFIKYRKEIILMLTGHFACFYVLANPKFLWFID